MGKVLHKHDAVIRFLEFVCPLQMALPWSNVKNKQKVRALQTFKFEEDKMPLNFSFSTIITKIWSFCQRQTIN